MANRDFLFETKTQDFYKVQANILTEDITNNNFMPEDPRISKNKGLNTTKKNIVGAINEAFDMAHQAYVKNSGTAFIKTVNGIAPNGVGNVDVKNVDRSVGDALGRKIHETYITLNDLPKITKAAARSVNGKVPDSNGDVRLQIVSTINSLSPDRNGNVEINLDNFVTKNELFEEIGDAIKKIPKQKAITVNGVPPDLDNNIVLRRVPESTKATRDGDDNIIADTYITKEKLDGAIDALSTTVVHSINGRTPNSDGTFVLDSVPKDGAGNVITTTYARKEDVYLKAQVDNKIAEAHSGISTPEQLSENAAFKSKYAAKEDVYTKTQADAKITEAINALPNAETLSLNPAFTDKYVNKTTVYTKGETDQKIVDAISTVDAQTLSQNTAFTDKFAAKTDISTLQQKLTEAEEKILKLKKISSGVQIKTWKEFREYDLNDLVAKGTHVYRITDIDRDAENECMKLGENIQILIAKNKKPLGMNIKSGNTIIHYNNNKQFLGKIENNKSYSLGDTITNDKGEILFKCIKSGDSGNNATIDENGGTVGDAEFGREGIIIKFESGKIFHADDMPYIIIEHIDIDDGKELLFPYMIDKKEKCVCSKGDIPDNFTSGNQTLGSYVLTYIGEKSDFE